MSRWPAMLALLVPAVAIAAPWTFVADDSRLAFTAYYDGEPFDGRFERFSVALDFDPASPESARLDVRIDPRSVDTDNRDRDEALAEPEWFDFANIGESRYRASGFEFLGGNRYRAAGELSLKGATRAVVIDFEWRREASSAVLSGVARMVGDAEVDRMDFGIGTGDWEDPELIGHRVDVRFEVVFQRP